MSIRNLSCALGALALVLACSGAAVTHADENVPFKGEMTATFRAFVPPSTGLFDVTGKSTHMGRITGQARVYFTPLPKDADLTLVAPNGDEVYLKTHGEPDATGAFVGTYQVGRHGRFEDATGSGSWTSVALDDETVVSTWSGDISY